ncbi:hypothetical protein [Helicobacter bilis]|uniref:hypothetical protein n=1 Tax=Helicobacter bilis TaxID=37372 RepID=UPI002557D352|nr:hypothetical protein [Helicobacter bilis]
MAFYHGLRAFVVLLGVDFGGASFYQGFFAYIFHAYKISINNKYTESSRIFISNIHNGNEFVSAVNECRDILIQNGKI